MFERIRTLFHKFKLKSKPEPEKEQPYIHKIPRFIDASQLLTLTSRGWYIGDRRLSPEEASQLAAEAREFSKSYLWQLMRRDVHYMAYLQATAKCRTESDLIYAGAMYRDLEILEEFMKRCKTL